MEAAATALLDEFGYIRTMLVVEEWPFLELIVALGAERMEERYVKFWGNWRAPLFEEIGGNLRMLLQQAACHKMISEHEVQRGFPYTHVVWSRIDFLWMADHPPVHGHSLSSRPVVWIPRNEDWYGGGLNDRHALATRAASDTYLTRWHMVADGTAVQYLREPPVKNSGEVMLRLHLQARGVSIARFDPVSFILCCVPSETCLHESGIERPLSRVIEPRCAKYHTEAYSVLRVISGLGTSVTLGLGKHWWARTPGWLWEASFWPHFQWEVAHDEASPGLPVSGPGGEELSEDIERVLRARWELRCCTNPSGSVSAWRWILFRQCTCIR